MIDASTWSRADDSLPLFELSESTLFFLPESFPGDTGSKQLILFSF